LVHARRVRRAASVGPAARRESVQLGELVGALRLPKGAFAAAAGPTRCATSWSCVAVAPTSPAIPRGTEPWDCVVGAGTPDGMVAINEYFARHPERVLGELRGAHGQYREADMTVLAHTGPLGAELRVALAQVTTEARRAGLVREEGQIATVAAPGTRAGAERKEGAIVTDGAGGFCTARDGHLEAFRPPTAQSRAGALVELRDTLAELLAVQELSVDDTEMLAVQFRLNQSYDDYHRRFGPLNRFKLVPTGRTKPRSGIAAEGADDGGDESRRTVASPRRWGGFRNDPDHRTVLALEVFDPEGQTATKAPVFRRRVLGPRHRALGADNAADAVAISLDERGE